MPELPEVENARRLIAEHALGRRIADVDDSDSYVLRPHPPGELKSVLTGRRLTAAHRRGKTMWVETSGTSDGPEAVKDAAGPERIHLGMSGRLVVTAPDGTVIEAGDPYRYGGRGRNPVWSRFTLTFADGGSLVLLDPRRLGRVRLNPEISGLGPDATQVTPAQFRALITRGTIAVKARLLDQSKIAGILGNLLADEIAWQAKVSPLTPVSQLTPAQVRRLYQAMTAVVAAALAHGGAHTGEIITQRHPGGTCPRDGAPMAHAVVGGRSTWYCSREQALRRARRRPAGELRAGAR